MASYLGNVFGWLVPLSARLKNRKGVTIVELAVSLSVSGIMAAGLGYSYDGWMSRYAIESVTKEIYADLMDARVKALQRNRTHFVTLSANRYQIYEDSTPSPDGDKALKPAEDRRVAQKELDRRFPISWSGVADTKVAFTPRGLSNDKKTICIFSEHEPDYDCLEISPTRINIGKIVRQPSEGGRCISTNCSSR